MRDHGTLVLCVAASVTAAGLLALSHFRIDPDLGAFYPKNDPVVEITHRLYGDAYGGRSVLMVLRHQDPRTLDEAMPSIVEGLRASPFLDRVIATREEWLGPRLEWMSRSPLLCLSEASRAALRDRIAGPGRGAVLEETRRRLAVDPLAGEEVAKRDPLGLRWFFEEALERDASPFPVPLRPGSRYLLFERPCLALVRVVPRDPWWNVDSTRAMLEDLRGRLAIPALTVEFAGGHVSTATLTPRIMADLKLLIICSFALVLLFLFWMTRHPLLPFVLILPIGAAILCGFGVGGLLLGAVAPTTVAVAVILMGQGMDFPIHFVSRYRLERRVQSPDDAFVSAHGSIGRPVLGAGLTTLVAFLVLGVSRFPGINQFGFLHAAGLSLCIVASMTAIPVLLRRFDRFVVGREAPAPAIVRLARALGRSRLRLPIAATLLAAGLLSWGFLAVRGVDVNLDLSRVAPPDDPSQKVFDRLEEGFKMSLIPVFALVDASVPVDQVRAKAEALRVRGISAYSDGPQGLFPSAAAARGREEFLRETAGWVDSVLKEMEGVGFQPAPFRRGLQEIQERFAAPPPSVADLDQPRYAAIRASVLLDQPGRPCWVLSLYPRQALRTPGERAAFDAAVRSELGPEVALFSVEHSVDHESRLLRRDMGMMASLVAAAVAVLTLLFVGGVRDGLLALVPVAVATGVMLSVQGIFSGPLNLISMAALPIVIGISVDDGIYYLCRRREPDHPGSDRTLADIGPGVWGSTATTLVAFGSLLFSVSRGMAELGLLVIIGRTTALIATLCVLPVLVKTPRPAARETG